MATILETLSAAAKQFIGDLPNEIIFEFLKEGTKKFVGSITDRDIKVVRAKLGLQSSIKDEQLFDASLTQLRIRDGNAHSDLLARLGALSGRTNNYYRLIVTGEPNEAEKDKLADEARRINDCLNAIQGHALMDQPDWDNYVKVMNLHSQAIEQVVALITNAPSAIARANQKLGNAVVTSGLAQHAADTKSKAQGLLRGLLR